MRLAPLLSLVILLLSTACACAQKDLVLADKTYEPTIKTVQLYPDQGGPDDSMLPAATALSAFNLVLEFDDLQANRANYYASLIHCTYDWEKSSLQDLDFLHDYNESPLNDYSFSSGPYSAYVHYRFPVPPVRLPGNYVIRIYRDGNKSDLMLTRRFLVYSNTVSLKTDNQLLGTAALQQTTQPINFTLDYSGMEILNPMDAIHVVIRQDQRWDNAKFDIKPTFVRDGDNQLEFHNYDQDKMFPGGNEFRWVDFRSLTSPGQNTGHLDKTVRPFRLTVQTDKPRGEQAYAQYNDLDGNYQITGIDSGDPRTGSNYLNVTFFLNAGTPLQDPVYIIGAFNNWQKTTENQMNISPEKGTYEATLFLKQGLYNYLYWVESANLPGSYFEGNHFETQNVYEVLVYNHAFQPNADMLVGYFLIPVNQR